MKHLSLSTLGVLLLFLLFRTEARACHGLPLVNYIVNVGPNGVTISAESNPASCGCGPIYMETEIRCVGSGGFTGNPPAWNAPTIWNSPPWYHSTLNIPGYGPPNWLDNCVPEPYFPIFIPFTDLCPGASYQLRSRENPCGSGGTPGPWTTAFLFTTPGVPATAVLNVVSSNDSVCVGQPVTCSASLTSSNSCLNSANPVYTWTTNPVQPGTPFSGTNFTFTPASSCVVTLTVTDNNTFCYPALTDSFTVFVGNPVATVVAAASSPVCQGGCVPLLASFNVQGAVQWEISPNGITWTAIPGATTSSYLHCPVNALSYFRAKVTGGCNTATSNVVTVNTTPVATLNVTPSSPSICAGQPTTLAATGASTYTWNGGSLVNASGASQTVSPTVTTTYTVTGNPQSACPSTQTVTVVVNPLPQLVFSPASPQVCPGGSVVFTCGADSNFYNWNIGSTLATLSPGVNDSMLCTPNGSASYQVTAVSPAGCSVNGIYQVNVLPAPAVSTSSDSLRVCPSFADTVMLGGAMQYAVSPVSGVNLLNVNGSIMVFSPASSQTYLVIGTDSLGCSDSVHIHVQADSLATIAAGNDTAICAGQSISLTASGAQNYAWSGAGILSGGNTATPLVAPAVSTSYIVTGTDADGCTGTDSVHITVNALPAITFDIGIDSICFSEPQFQISALPPGGVFFGTNYNNVFGNILYPNAVYYDMCFVSYTYTDVNGCTNSALDSLFIDICISVEEHDALQTGISVFPNPAQDMFTIRLSNAEPAVVEVFSADGKLVHSRTAVQNELQVDCSRWAVGTYVLRATQNGHTRTLKLVVH